MSHVITIIIPDDLRTRSVQGDLDDKYVLWPSESLSHVEAITVDGQAHSVLSEALNLIFRLQLGERVPTVNGEPDDGAR